MKQINGVEHVPNMNQNHINFKTPWSFIPKYWR